MPVKPTFKQRFQYFFDNFMSKGTIALIGGLGLISLLPIFLAGLVISFGGRVLAPEGSPGLGFVEATWESLMRTLDPGTMGGDSGWGFRLVMLSVTLGGIFIVSTLIGVLTAGVEGKLEALRKGRSLVLESDHTLILGWSPQVFTILSELMQANANQKKASLVILADKDKVEMEEEISARVEQIGRTKIICRSGSPLDAADLEIVNPHVAKAILVLPAEVADPDTAVVKTVLAITNHFQRREQPCHIVAPVGDPKNKELLEMIGKRDRVQAILTGDLIARLTAQTSRQSGLSVVYTELLNFCGDEIYFTHEPTLVGKTYGEALLAYETSAVMGIKKRNGAALLNPPMDTTIEADDQLFALTADDDTFIVSGLTAVPIDEAAICLPRPPSLVRPERSLILGWNRYATTIIRELDHYMPDGSEVLLVADPTVSSEVSQAEQILRQECAQLCHQKITFCAGDITNRSLLEAVQAAEFDHVIVLSYAGLEVQEADARTLVTLLHLRKIAEQDDTPFSIVSEMLDLRNRQLAEVTRVDDFIVSNHLISLMMAQLAENGDLYAVFAELFDPQSAEIYLKPASDFVQAGEPLAFYTVVEAARRRGQTTIG